MEDNIKKNSLLEEYKNSVEINFSKQLDEEKDKFLRLFAEFENYKKRTQKERLEILRTATLEVMNALIPILDDLRRSVTELKKCKDDEYFRGIKLIQDKFERILREQGLESIETKSGDDFNTDIHEAVTQMTAPSEELKGKVINIIERGYTLGGKVIKHAKVIVGK